MRILKIIHGYPPRYNAGSEVYSRTLCAELSKRHEVHVFTREENLFLPDGGVRQERDALHPNIELHIVNAARTGTNYNNTPINTAFARVVDDVRPDVAHIGHLNHLSLGIMDELAEREIPVVFTLHDFWLMCLRGQFIQIEPSDNGDVFPLCNGQENKKCADRCLRRFSGDDTKQSGREEWIKARMEATRRTAELTDIFISPSRHLADRFSQQFSVPPGKIEYLDYGFDCNLLSGRDRAKSDAFVFGYIGTHIPGKGVHHLLDAFQKIAGECGNAELHIWGRSTANTAYLQDMISRTMPQPLQQRIKWRGEYQNTDIVTGVFNQVDAIVVPSIWEENSPLVIHEAQQCRVPVITADMGGMSEYVEHEENGLLFAPRDSESLARQMKKIADDPALGEKLGQRGYLHSANGDVPDITSHAAAVENIYQRAIDDRNLSRLSVGESPWRITFDTNPDHCNYHCTMCEEHSPYSPLQFYRREAGIPKRVMPFDLIQRNVELMAKKGLREIIPSTMGEPLLYKNFEDIIALCERTGVMLNLTTNGSFPRLGVDKWAKLLVPVTSDVKISWNGACKKTQEAVMQNAKWEEMLDNARDFIAVRDAHAQSGGNRCRVTFQMTFMETNSQELPDLVRLAASLGVDRVKGHHLWAHFAEIKGEDMRRSEDSVRRWNSIVEQTRKAAAESLLPNGKEVLLENIDFLDANGGSTSSGKCPFLGKEAWVNAQGRFDPCCAPDAERRTLGEFGNLHDTDLPEIWNSSEYRRLVKTYRSRAVCLKCNMRGMA